MTPTLPTGYLAASFYVVDTGDDPTNQMYVTLRETASEKLFSFKPDNENKAPMTFVMHKGNGSVMFMTDKGTRYRTQRETYIIHYNMFREFGWNTNDANNVYDTAGTLSTKTAWMDDTGIALKNGVVAEGVRNKDNASVSITPTQYSTATRNAQLELGRKLLESDRGINNHVYIVSTEKNTDVELTEAEPLHGAKALLVGYVYMPYATFVMTNGQNNGELFFGGVITADYIIGELSNFFCCRTDDTFDQLVAGMPNLRNEKKWLETVTYKLYNKDDNPVYVY
ncbi:hypothetical protein FACS1894120_6420 [Clostridia bacterium]|nr:hypothetical protein FACS1894120_6420 [Clostridia bacterium]